MGGGGTWRVGMGIFVIEGSAGQLHIAEEIEGVFMFDIRDLK